MTTETMRVLAEIVEKLKALPQPRKPDMERDRSPYINYFNGRLLDPVAEADRILARRRARRQNFKQAAE